MSYFLQNQQKNSIKVLFFISIDPPLFAHKRKTEDIHLRFLLTGGAEGACSAIKMSGGHFLPASFRYC